MKVIIVSLLLLVIPTLAIDSIQPVEPASATAPAPDLFRLTPETFLNHTPAQKLLDRANVDPALLSVAIFQATNRQRARHQFHAFLHSEALHRAAQAHSRAMATGGFFSHENPKDPARKTMQQRLQLEGVTKGFRAENIAKTPIRGLTYLTAAEAIVAQWMKSPGHRSNILDRNMRYLSCGIAVDPKSPHFYILSTQNFSSEVPAPPLP